MKHVVDNNLVPSRESRGPLAPWIDAFSVWVGQQGYTHSSISRRVLLATGFNGWLEHEGIDRGTAMGRRDYAILLLLARLGLRSSEVVFLKLDDIDWGAGTLHAHTKGGAHKEFPLPHEVGEAIADYLCNGRPSSAGRRVFLRCLAPAQGFRGPSAINSLIRHSIERAGVNAPTFGAHQFRHSLATEMMRQGASLSEIGDVLGHRHPDTAPFAHCRARLAYAA